MAQNQNSPAEAGPLITKPKNSNSTVAPERRPADWIRGVEAMQFGRDWRMKLLLLAIARASANDGSGVCTHLSHDMLAVAAEVHPDTVWRLIDRAEKRGLLAKEKRNSQQGRRHNRYRLLIQPIQENAHVVTEKRECPTDAKPNRRPRKSAAANRRNPFANRRSEVRQPTISDPPTDAIGKSDEEPHVDHPLDHHEDHPRGRAGEELREKEEARASSPQSDASRAEVAPDLTQEPSPPPPTDDCPPETQGAQVISITAARIVEAVRAADPRWRDDIDGFRAEGVPDDELAEWLTDQAQKYAEDEAFNARMRKLDKDERQHSSVLPTHIAQAVRAVRQKGAAA